MRIYTIPERRSAARRKKIGNWKNVENVSWAIADNKQLHFSADRSTGL